VVSDLYSVGNDVNVVDLHGTDVYKTNANITERLNAVNGVFIINPTAVPDALSVAPLAAAKSFRFLLTDALGNIPADFAVDFSRETYIIGGAGVVKTHLSGVTRLGGVDRYETNWYVCSTLYVPDTMYVANGQTMADALSVAPLAARSGAPVALTNGKSVPRFVNAVPAARRIALGGSAVVPDDIMRGVAVSGAAQVSAAQASTAQASAAQASTAQASTAQAGGATKSPYVSATAMAEAAAEVASRWPQLVGSSERIKFPQGYRATEDEAQMLYFHYTALGEMIFHEKDCIVDAQGNYLAMIPESPYKYMTDEETVRAIFEDTNKLRVAQGLPPYKWSNKLNELAQIRAEEQHIRFSHWRPNGDMFFSIFDDAGIGGLQGENITSASWDAMDSWLSSPGHAALILDEDKFEYMGVGVSGIYAVQLFNGFDNDWEVKTEEQVAAMRAAWEAILES
jgi:uncharacterized protein YkwD